MISRLDKYQLEVMAMTLVTVTSGGDVIGKLLMEASSVLFLFLACLPKGVHVLFHPFLLKIQKTK